MDQVKIVELSKKMQWVKTALDSEIFPNGDVLQIVISDEGVKVLTMDKVDKMAIEKVTFNQERGALTTYYTMQEGGITFETNETEYLPAGTLPDCEYEAC